MFQTQFLSQSKARFRIPSNFPLGDSFVCVSSLQLLDPDTRCFANIKDMPTKLQRSTTALELAWKFCQHQRNVAFITIILFLKEGLFSIYSHKYIHTFTDRSSLFIDFLNTLVHRLFTVLNCIDTFTYSYFSLSFMSLSWAVNVLTPPTTLWLDNGQSFFFQHRRCYSLA